MSRHYEAHVEIKDFNKKKRAAIESAAEEIWNFENDWYLTEYGEPALSATGQGSLCGGESEEQFSARLARAIFKANGKPCAVTVTCTCLENLPCESYSFDKDSLDGDDLFPCEHDDEKDGVCNRCGTSL